MEREREKKAEDTDVDIILHFLCTILCILIFLSESLFPH